MQEEKLIWKGNPSQVMNFLSFVACTAFNLIIIAMAVGTGKMGLFGLLLLPSFYAFWKWLELKFIQYEVTTTRVRKRIGLLSIRRDDLELYRVKDITVRQPLTQRLFSVGTIHLQTSDRSTPELVLYGIPKVDEIREQIRNAVEYLRDKKRVREIDVDVV